jgi:predicted metal-dependent hydrolase
MESIEIQSIVHALTEQFGVQMGKVEFRQKQSMISLHLHDQKVNFSFSNTIYNDSKERIEALIYVMLAKFTHSTHRPLYDEYLRILRDIKRVPPQTSILKNTENVTHAFDLSKIMNDLINQYSFIFADAFEKYYPSISWSTRTSVRKFGMYRKINHSIVVAKVLDKPQIPVCVINYIVYHELLHAFLGIKTKNKRYIAHDGEFHEMEKQFIDLDRANLFLTQYSQYLRNQSKVIR